MDSRMVSLVPAAIYALCGGFLIPYTADGTPKPYNHALEQENDEIFECSVETIAKLEIVSCDSASQSFHHQNVRLPRQIKDSLLSEAESDFIKSLEEIEIESMDLVEVFFTSAFVSKYLYFSYRTRAEKRQPLLLTKSIQHVSKLLDRATSLFQEDINDVCLNSYPGASNNYNVLCSAVEPLRTFLSSPFFDYLRDQDIITNSGIHKSLEKLLRTMVNLFKEYSSCFIHVQSETMQVDLSSSDSSKQTSISRGSGKSRIVDVELDASEASKNGSTLLNSNMILRWKLEILQLVSSFFTALPAVTWEILFDLMRKEIEHQVCDKILSCLCQHPQGASPAQLTDLVNSIKDAVETRVRAKLPCSDLITASCNFLGASQPLFADEKVTHQPSKETDIEQNLKCLADIVDNLAESNLLDWTDRIKLIGCLCNIIALSPPVGQIVIGRLLTFLHDPDYRVRLFMARKIGILFRTWDGHTELYHDIRANFGVKLVSCSQENLITAQEALAAGPPPMTTMETIVVTLIHIALHSDKMELEAVFMTCAAAAIDPGLRELIMAALDNLSSNLHYSSRAKYFEELMGQILFCWVTCGMDFPALVGIRDLFVSRVEPKYFIQYCCHWILPALVITVDTPNLKWIASVACEPLGILVRRLIHTELVSGVPAIFSHFITNLPAFHQVLVFICIKSVPVPHVKPEERFLVGRIGPKEYRIYRCIVRYGYRDVHKDDTEFENDLVCSIAEFIRSGKEDLDAAKKEDTSNDDDIMTVVGTCSSSTGHVQLCEDPDSRTSTISQTDLSPPNEIRSPSPATGTAQPRKKRVRFILPESPKIDRSAQEELRELMEAREAGVAYIMGNSYVRAKKGSSFVKKITINYIYDFLRRNSRRPTYPLNAPRASTLEIGMIYDV